MRSHTIEEGQAMNATTNSMSSDVNTAEKTGNAEAIIRRVAVLKRVMPFASGLAVLIGVLVLLGWAFDLHVLKSVLPGLPVMVPNTALCLALAGSALLWIGSERSSSALRRLGKGSAIIILLV